MLHKKRMKPEQPVAPEGLLLQIEALAARAYAEEERDTGFILACVARAVRSKRIPELCEVFHALIGQQDRLLIVKNLAREAAEVSLSLN